HRVAEDQFAVARAAAVPEAGLRAGRAQVDELRGIGNGERLQQHLMEDRKDASGRANPERERDNGDGRDEGSSEKRADGELETAHKALDEPRYCGVCRLGLTALGLASDNR